MEKNYNCLEPADKLIAKLKKIGKELGISDPITTYYNVCRKELRNSRNEDSKNTKEEIIKMDHKAAVSSPWVGYYHKLKALFGEDPDIDIEYNEQENKILMRVENRVKAYALELLLPSARTFGNVTVHTYIIPANNNKIKRVDLIEKAFEGNPVFERVYKLDGVFANPISYVIFNKKVAQYFDDNLCDPHGNVSCLYQDLAKDVFGEGEGVFFCTSNQD